MKEINDCIATGAELFDNLELMRWLPVVVCGGTVGNETNGLSLEKETIADDVARSEDVFDCLGSLCHCCGHRDPPSFDRRVKHCA